MKGLRDNRRALCTCCQLSACDAQVMMKDNIQGPRMPATLKLMGNIRNALDWYFLCTVISAIIVRLRYGLARDTHSQICQYVYSHDTNQPIDCASESPPEDGPVEAAGETAPEARYRRAEKTNDQDGLSPTPRRIRGLAP